MSFCKTVNISLNKVCDYYMSDLQGETYKNYFRQASAFLPYERVRTAGHCQRMTVRPPPVHNLVELHGIFRQDEL